MDLGERIAHQRASRGWSQEELAHRAGVSRASVQNAEIRGGAGRSVITRIAGAFGLAYDQLTAAGVGGEPPALADIPTDVLAAELARRLANPPPQRHRYDVVMPDGTTVTVLADRPLTEDEKRTAAQATQAGRAGVSS